MQPDRSELNSLMECLQERAKELKCLYRVEEALRETSSSLAEVLPRLCSIIPAGCQFPSICRARFVMEDAAVGPGDFRETPWLIKADIRIENQVKGRVEVAYLEPPGTTPEFLPDEQRLLHSIAERVASFMLFQTLSEAVSHLEISRESLKGESRQGWRIIIDMLRRTDTELYFQVARKMMNYLCWIGVVEAGTLPKECGIGRENGTVEFPSQDSNKPAHREQKDSFARLAERTFTLAAQHLADGEIVALIQKWMQSDKLSFFVLALENLSTTLNEIQNAITRFHHQGFKEEDLPVYTRDHIHALLVQRFFTEQTEFIRVAKRYIDIDDFYELFQNMIFPNNGYGKLGGKSAGIFIAQSILGQAAAADPALASVRVPKTWYITSDTLQRYLNYNDIKEISEQKYKPVEEVRYEYPNVVQIFKNAHFPPEIIKSLSLALDDFSDRPIIVRSSSLLEDRVGAAFSGKYKSLFLANQGSKQERLSALMDAVAEVYASTFHPDPIEYRKERGFLDFHEEMAVIIQEVVGARVGDYFFPSFAGVAFSHNEFRWSPRILREDGVVRLVPGLGTRAVDRVSDDFPVLLSPGRPDLKVSVSPEDRCRYSPRLMDVINIRTNTLETVEVRSLLRAWGGRIPGVEHMVSEYRDGRLVSGSPLGGDFEEGVWVVTFDGLAERTRFMPRLKTILDTLKDKLGFPVDIEFAVDGEDFYLLQCRAQNYGRDAAPARIPRDVPPDRVLFTARRYVCNGILPDITHVVYVDPDRYAEAPSRDDLLEVGKIVGRLNKLLPKRKFVLVGPGRWGSRGDIKLGVSVTYADINNTAMLVEVAQKKGNYTPDLSFGTHFFQDLFEASIRYLPLYPDESGVVFNSRFFLDSANILPDLLPDAARFGETVRVIDVGASTGGLVLKVHLNADLDEAIAFFDPPVHGGDRDEEGSLSLQTSENHWLWRLRMAEQIARQLDGEKYAVSAMYVFGSVKNAAAGARSDIDILVHFHGGEAQRSELSAWLDGWSRCLGQINFLRTGFQTDGLLDVHLVTDQDIRDRSSYAVKIGAVTDAARLIEMKKRHRP